MPLAVGIVADTYNNMPFTPATLTALAGWWDATDPAVFTYGTGTQVASWADKSPNGFTVSRTPDANVQRTGTINGLACVTQTLAPQYLSRASVNVQSLVDSVGRTDCMNFVVLSYSAPASGGWFGCGDLTYRVSFDVRTPNHYLDVATYTSARLTGTATHVASTPYLFAVYRNGANMKFFRDGVELLSKSNATSNVPSSYPSTLQLLTPSGGGFLGSLGECIHVARYDAADFTATQNYLKAKWGTP